MATLIKFKLFSVTFIYLSLLIVCNHAVADIDYYTNELTWNDKIINLETFITNSTSIAKSNEVLNPPGYRGLLGSHLTFNGIETGLSIDFEVITLQPNAQFVYNDHPDIDTYPVWYEALSIGQLNQYEDDDWQINIPSLSNITAFSFDLIGNHYSPDKIYVYGTSGLLGEFSNIPANGDTAEFLGFTTNEPITAIKFDSGEGIDDIAIANFRFANVQAVPEPISSMLFLFGGSIIWLQLRKRKINNM